MLIEKEIARLPTEDEAVLAKEASRVLDRHKKDGLTVRMADDTELVLPKAAFDLLHSILVEMARGNAVTIFPIHAELTTQEAADQLNVSRPYLIKLVEEGKIPHHKVGTHRRIRYEDLMNFRKEFERTSRQARDELAAEAQDIGLGY